MEEEGYKNGRLRTRDHRRDNGRKARDTRMGQWRTRDLRRDNGGRGIQELGQQRRRDLRRDNEIRDNGRRGIQEWEIENEGSKKG
jgi:hypothetical protein